MKIMIDCGNQSKLSPCVFLASSRPWKSNPKIKNIDYLRDQDHQTWENHPSRARRPTSLYQEGSRYWAAEREQEIIGIYGEGTRDNSPP